MSPKSDIDPTPSKAHPRFRSEFYLSVAAGLLILAGLSSPSPADNPFFCAIAFGFALIGFFLAKNITTRFFGVVLTGVCGGFLASYIRTQYF